MQYTTGKVSSILEDLARCVVRDMPYYTSW